jgi:uncharacterized protein
MNRITLTLATVLSLAFTQATAQDYNKGLKAYKAGDFAKAFKEFKPLAEQGNVDAQFELGFAYYSGKGVLKDYAKGLKWSQMAAKQGNRKAQAILGSIYADGKGVLKDNLTAHMWFNISSANEHLYAGKYRDKLEKKMTASDISQATAMAKECMNSNYKNCGF